MLFNSFEFLLFYPLVTVVFFLLSQRLRWFWLLAASCYFYMFFVPVYILILGGTILLDYWLGIWLERADQDRRKSLLALSIAANVGVLAVFKYYNFFVDNASVVMDWLGWQVRLPYLQILLPVGLSFHTFQAMSYTIEVYRGKQKAEKHFGIYALYVMFYPQLVAGPIERPQNMLHQFHEKKKFDPQLVADGLFLMLWGLFKKLVVADRLAKYVDAVFNNYTMHSGASLALGAVFFSIQIYCDFSGYSDIALGVAKTMDFRLMENFKRPYFATNITQFWRRWHISLSTWFKDYLYIPLGGNRVAKWRWYLNLFIVFLISGFWHGAAWSFIIWGALHGLYNTISLLLKNTHALQTGKFSTVYKKLTAPVFSIPFTFCLVSVAWVFFRAESLKQAFSILSRIFSKWEGNLFISTKVEMAYMCTGILILLCKEALDEYGKPMPLHSRYRSLARVSSTLLLLVLILLIGVFNNTQFIYFQF